MSNDHLIVRIEGEMLDATLHISTVAADELGPTHKKYWYELSDRQTPYGYSRREAFDLLLKITKERGWKVYKPLN